MMRGYDRDEAIRFISSRIVKKQHPELADRLEELIGAIIDADMAYMHEAGVLDENGNAGDMYYEEDDAIEFIVERLVAEQQLSPDQAVKLASLVDDYLDYQEEYLESKGLVQWD